MSSCVASCALVASGLLCCESSRLVQYGDISVAFSSYNLPCISRINLCISLRNPTKQLFVSVTPPVSSTGSFGYFQVIRGKGFVFFKLRCRVDFRLGRPPARLCLPLFRYSTDVHDLCTVHIFPGRSTFFDPTYFSDPYLVGSRTFHWGSLRILPPFSLPQLV